MIFKKILTFILLTLSIFQLSSCTNSTKNHSNITTIENTKAPYENNIQENDIQENDMIYKSKLGCTLEFPQDWKDNYIIDEKEESLYVYIDSKDANKNTYQQHSGLLFCIIKSDNMSTNEPYVPITDNEYITLNNTTYFVGGSDELGLDPNSDDFCTFIRMNSEREQVINSIRI